MMKTSLKFFMVLAMGLATVLEPVGVFAAGKKAATSAGATTTTTTTTTTSTTPTSTTPTSQTQTCSSVVYKSTTSPANDIVFVFDKGYTCGQFANGDAWVTPFPDAALQIVSIAPDAANGMNGFEVNPSIKTKQGFDYRVAGYTASLQPALPLTLSGNVSVVKTVSVPVSTTACRPCLQHAAVLTVTANPVPNSSTVFRPGYFGQNKIFTNVVLTGKSLNKLSATCCLEVSKVPIDKITARYNQVQLDHLENYVGREMHPIESMPDYGADIARDNAIYLLRMLLSDFDVSNPSHQAALISYLQMAVDLRSMAANGATWPANGGHGNGRKLPIVFAGWFLNDSSFQDSLATSSFSEDKQVYFSTKANMALYGRDCGTDSAYWKTTIFASGSRDCRDPYGLIDGGGHEIGAAYQTCCTAKPWKYTALAVRMLGIQALWGNDALLNYADRWVSFGVKASDTCAPYNGVAADYKVQYGPTSQAGACIPGTGRWPSKDGTAKDSGFYSSLLGDQIWSAWKLNNP